ncbi:MAG TPA: hypothetical protein VLH56_02535 [Dissulfurispiraceae bacterium]|nr:hypothetical protein [Dissulfurispiraceae bacterium]
MSDPRYQTTRWRHKAKDQLGGKGQQQRHGYSQGCDVNGNPIDPNHPWRKG